MFAFLLIISVSYWYCLPVTTQSFVMYSEFRGYDFLLLILVAVVLVKYKRQLKLFFRRNKPGRWILRFCIWATITFLMTVGMSLTYRRPIFILMTSVMLFHLWGFVIAYAALRIFVTKRSQCLLLLDTFLVIGAIQALIIALQGMHVLPVFWGIDYQSTYGRDAFSGTLGPNRQLPGHTMLLVFGVGAAYWRNAASVGVKRLWLAAIAALGALTGLGFSGSRTAWVAFVTFILAAILVRRPRPAILIFIFIVGIGTTTILPVEVGNRVTEIYQERVTSKLEAAPKDADAVAKFRQIDAGRYKNWQGGIDRLFASPWILPFGGGFNNYRWLVGIDISAHNIYITLLIETGLVGLLLYLMWLRSVAVESKSVIAWSEKQKRRRRNLFQPTEMRALLLAMMVSLFAGEILYPFRPGFAFLGMFLFLIAIMNHPALVMGDRQTLAPPKKMSPYLPYRFRKVA
jgi:O-antigen ligase